MASREGGDDGSIRKELDSQLASNKPTERVQYGVATHAIYTCDEDTLLGGKELAKKHNAHLSIHISETRKEVADCFKKLECILLNISIALTTSSLTKQSVLTDLG